MRAIAVTLILVIGLSGCATYKFKKGQSPYDQGYVVARDNYTILEYTRGKDFVTPDLPLAKERFKRRKSTVEDYYKKMGYIENRFKETFMDPISYLAGFVVGLFRFPFIAVSIYKYEHNPQYRAKVDKIKDQKYALETEHVALLKSQLNAYIDKDLAGENFIPQTFVSEEKSAPPLVGETAAKTAIGPVAVIIANPQKGPSPLTVNFRGTKSYSANAKIISYEWDFGDGDTSRKKNPLNTFLSATYGMRHFNVTLTVTDDQGKSASAEKVIEVLAK